MKLKIAKLQIENHKSGFTLIELLIVITIIGILSATLMQTLNTSRTKAYDSKVKQQLSAFRAAAEIYYLNQNPVGYGSTVINCTSGIFGDTSDQNGNPNAYLQFIGINPAPTLVCGANSGAFAVKATLINGGYWCIDSNGVSKPYAGAIGPSATQCPP